MSEPFKVGDRVIFKGFPGTPWTVDAVTNLRHWPLFRPDRQIVQLGGDGAWRSADSIERWGGTLKEYTLVVTATSREEAESKARAGDFKVKE